MSSPDDMNTSAKAGPLMDVFSLKVASLRRDVGLVHVSFDCWVLEDLGVSDYMIELASTR